MSLLTKVVALAIIGQSALEGGPFGLKPVNEVELAVTDPKLEAYHQVKGEILDYLADYERFGRFVPETDGRGEVLIDNKIIVPEGAEIRAYFIAEHAAFSNSFGFVKGQRDLQHPENEYSLIFPSVTADGINDLDFVEGSVERGVYPFAFDPAPNRNALRQAASLFAWDPYVELGKADRETEYLFFLIPDGADAPKGRDRFRQRVGDEELEATVWWTEDQLNKDSQRHAHVVKFVGERVDYYLIAFEDVPLPAGLAADFNDLYTVIEVRH